MNFFPLDADLCLCRPRIMPKKQTNGRRKRPPTAADVQQNLQKLQKTVSEVERSQHEHEVAIHHTEKQVQEVEAGLQGKAQHTGSKPKHKPMKTQECTTTRKCIRTASMELPALTPVVAACYLGRLQ